jgi:hypothetical protein
MGEAELAKVDGEATHRYVCKGVAVTLKSVVRSFAKNLGLVSGKFIEVSGGTYNKTIQFI